MGAVDAFGGLEETPAGSRSEKNDERRAGMQDRNQAAEDGVAVEW